MWQTFISLKNKTTIKGIFCFLIFFSSLSAQVIDTVINFNDPPEELFYIPRGNELFINIGWRNHLAVLDCSTYQIKKVIPTGGSYRSAAYGTWNWRRDKIYFAFGIDPSDIVVIDNQTDSIIKRINFGSCWPMCYNSTNDKTYAVSLNSVAVINCEADSIIKIIEPQTYYLNHFVLWDSIGNKVYCGSDMFSDKVTVINCTNDSILAIISSGLLGPMGTGYNMQRRKVYVAGEFNHGFVIDAVADTQIRRYFHFPNYEWFEEIPLIYNSLEDKVYWPGGLVGDTLRIINSQNDSVIKIISLGFTTMDICFAPWSNRLYIAGYWPDSLGYLYILDCRSDSIITRMRFGHNFSSLDCNPLAHRIYLSGGYSLYVIRDEIPGIEELTILDDKRLSAEIYPNPARTFLAIRLYPTADHLPIKIFDVSGKLVKIDEKVTSTQSHKQEIRISLKGINTGIYFLQVGTEIKKLLVVR